MRADDHVIAVWSKIGPQKGDTKRANEQHAWPARQGLGVARFVGFVVHACKYRRATNKMGNLYDQTIVKQNLLPANADADVFARHFLLWSLRVRRTGPENLPENALIAAVRANNTLAPRHLIAIAVISVAGELTVSELAESEGIAVSTASLLVTKLVDAGLVVRREDATDRRRIWLSVHPSYRAEAEAILEQRLSPLRRVYERFSPKQMTSMLEVLDALAEELTRPELAEN